MIKRCCVEYAKQEKLKFLNGLISVNKMRTNKLTSDIEFLGKQDQEENGLCGDNLANYLAWICYRKELQHQLKLLMDCK